MRTFALLLLTLILPLLAACDSDAGSPGPVASISPPATQPAQGTPATVTPATTPGVTGATVVPATADTPPATPSPAPPTGTATVHVSPTSVIATPRAFEPITFSPGETLTDADLVLRQAGKSPPRIDIVPERVLIPDIAVDAEVSFHAVGRDGMMPAPDGAYDIAFYDFSYWPGLGGFAGSGGNVIAAGKTDEIGVGSAVLWRLRELAPGARVSLRMSNGATLVYVIEFNKVASAGVDWSPIVFSTREESLTLISGAGAVLPSGGGYVDRRIVWGRRVE